MVKMPQIPVIDLFAGPGGLGEGFSALKTQDGQRPFRIGISIEKEPQAHSTLQFRSFFRQFGDTAPSEYYEALRATDQPLDKRLDRLYSTYPEEAALAQSEAWRAELGKHDHLEVFQRIARCLVTTTHGSLLEGRPARPIPSLGALATKGKKITCRSRTNGNTFTLSI